MKKLSSILISTVLFLLPASVEAKNLYVDNSRGNDSISYANNDQNNPWRTIGRAAWGTTSRDNPNPSQAARAGDTVYIASGTYDDSSGFSSREPLYAPVNSGTAGNYITFQAVGTVELTTSGSNVSPIIGSSYGRPYIKWDGFTLNQANINYRAGNGLVQVKADHVTISNCTITGIHTVYDGYDDQHNAILAYGNSNDLLEGLVIRNCDISGFTGGSGRNDSAITLYYLGSAVIEHNRIHHSTTGIYAKTTTTDSSGVHIRYNLFHNQQGDCIVPQSHSYWYVYQNIFRDSSTGFTFFPTIYQTGTSKPRYLYVVNNTFDNIEWGAIYWKDAQFINNCFVQNNIITNSRYGIYSTFPYASMTTGRVAFNYNLFNNYNSFGIHSEGSGFSFASWQNDHQQDLNSGNNVNPHYVDASSNDFRLQPSSPCRADGPYAGVDILDLDNDGGTSDPIAMGAYIAGDETIGIVAGQGGGTEPDPPPVAEIPPSPNSLRIETN